MSRRPAAYTRDGRSPTVLLLHGVFMDHTPWDHVLELRSDVRAVALDMPGHGVSDPAGLASLDAAMDAVTSTLTAEDTRPVAIVGHSWGGMVGLRLAVARPVADQMATRLGAMGRTRIRQTLKSVLLAPEDALHLLGELRIPWRAVGGAQDYAIAGGVADVIRRQGDLVVAPGGNTSPLEGPQVIVDALSDVLDEIRRP